MSKLTEMEAKLRKGPSMFGHAKFHARLQDHVIELATSVDAIQGQWMVDDLKRSFTTTQIMDMMDASPYDEPDTGAPEVMG